MGGEDGGRCCGICGWGAAAASRKRDEIATRGGGWLGTTLFQLCRCAAVRAQLGAGRRRARRATAATSASRCASPLPFTPHQKRKIATLTIGAPKSGRPPLPSQVGTPPQIGSSHHVLPRCPLASPTSLLRIGSFLLRPLRAPPVPQQHRTRHDLHREMDALQLLNDGLAHNYHVHKCGAPSRRSRRAAIATTPFTRSSSKPPSDAHLRHRTRRNRSKTPPPLMKMVPCVCIAPSTAPSPSHASAQPVPPSLHRYASLDADAVSFAQDDFIAFSSSTRNHVDAFEFKSAPLRNFVACLAK